MSALLAVVAGAMVTGSWCVARYAAADCGTSVFLGRPSALVPACAAVVMSATLGAQRPDGMALAVALVAGAVATATDLQTGYVFDRVLAFQAATLVPIAAFSGALAGAIEGAATGAALFFVPWWCSRGRGLGLGDVKLAALLGFALGVAGALATVWVAVVAGGAAGTILLLARRATRKTEMRFAPFLAIGTLAAIASGRA